MHGACSLVLAEIGIPDARVCLVLAAPFLALMTLRWLSRQTGETIQRLFPEWAWEKKLGWLNLGAERRADAFLRWIGYLVYAALAAALYGIVWSARSLPGLHRWDDPYVMGELAVRLPVLLVCVGLWLVYLGAELIPKLRKQYERDELEKYRSEQEELEKDRETNPASRLKSPPPKPRVNLPASSGRMGPRR